MMDMNHITREENEFLPSPDEEARQNVSTEEEKSLTQDFRSYPQELRDRGGRLQTPFV